MRATVSVPDSATPSTRALLAAGVAVGGFLGGRRGFELLVETLRDHGLGNGPAALVAALPYLAFAAMLVMAALRLLARPPDRLGNHLLLPGALAQISIGYCLGAAFVAATLAIEVGAGMAGFTAGAAARGRASSLVAALIELGAIATAEELVFRLVLLESLVRLTPWPAAVMLSSLAYAVVHAGTGRLWPVWLASLVCFGVVASQLYAVRRTLWLPIGAHWGWDFASFAAFQTLPLTLRRPAWVVGQPYRLSAGLVMLLVLALTAATLTWRARREHSAAVAGYPPFE